MLLVRLTRRIVTHGALSPHRCPAPGHTVSWPPGRHAERYLSLRSGDEAGVMKQSVLSSFSWAQELGMDGIHPSRPRNAHGRGAERAEGGVTGDGELTSLSQIVQDKTVRHARPSGLCDRPRGAEPGPCNTA